MSLPAPPPPKPRQPWCALRGAGWGLSLGFGPASPCLLCRSGLAFACLGRMVDAEGSAEFASTVTRGVESVALVAAIRCLVAVESGRDDAHVRANELVDVAFRTGAIDILVTCYRASPGVLGML